MIRISYSLRSVALYNSAPETPAIPLPASVLLLFGGLGALGAAERAARRKFAGASAASRLFPARRTLPPLRRNKPAHERIGLR